MQKNNLNIFPMNIEKPKILVNFICFLKFMKGCIMSQDDQLFWIAVHLQKILEIFRLSLETFNAGRWLYIKDLGDFIKKLWNLGSIPDNAILVTADVVHLHPSIPHEAGLKALREVLDKREQHTFPRNELIMIADFVLKNSYFEFNDQIKQQISGTAIATNFASPYACLFMDKTETAFLETQELQPLKWFRYIDGIFLSGHIVSKNFKHFCLVLMSSILTIKFTYESSKESIAFLDLKFSVKNSKIITDLYVKSTDRSKYLHHLSACLNHTKRSVVFSQTLRISRLFSYEANFIKHKANMKSCFFKREYPEKLISAEMDKIKFSNIEKKLIVYLRRVYL